MLGFVISICTEIIPQLGARTPEELQRVLHFLEPSFYVSNSKTSRVKDGCRGSLRFAGVKLYPLVMLDPVGACSHAPAAVKHGLRTSPRQGLLEG